MDSFVIPWRTGTGDIVVKRYYSYWSISSTTSYPGVMREQTLTFRAGITPLGQKLATLKVRQKGTHVWFADNTGAIRTDRNGVRFAVRRQEE